MYHSCENLLYFLFTCPHYSCIMFQNFRRKTSISKKSIFCQFCIFSLLLSYLDNGGIINNSGGDNNHNNWRYKWWFFDCKIICIWWAMLWIVFGTLWNCYISCGYIFWYDRWRDRGIYDCNEVKLIVWWRNWYGYSSIFTMEIKTGWHFCSFCYWHGNKFIGYSLFDKNCRRFC